MSSVYVLFQGCKERCCRVPSESVFNNFLPTSGRSWRVANRQQRTRSVRIKVNTQSELNDEHYQMQQVKDVRQSDLEHTSP